LNKAQANSLGGDTNALSTKGKEGKAMSGRLSGGLVLALGFLVGQAQAGDVQWRAAPAGRVPAASPAVAQGQSGLPPGVSLGQPTALEAPAADPVRTVSFRSDLPAPDQPVFRAKREEPRPMPIGNPDQPAPPPDDRSFIGPNSHPLPQPTGPGPVPGPESAFGIDNLPPGGPPLAGVPGAFGNLCPDPCCDGHPGCCFDTCCGPCAQPGRFWASADYLAWWIKDSRTPPLVTTSPAGTPVAMAGVLGVPGTMVLHGSNDLENEEFSGGRFTAGAWLDSCKTIGLEGSFMFLGQRTNNFMAGSLGAPILARPFFDARGFENAQLVAFPGVVAGNVVVSRGSSLWGADADLRYRACCGCLWGGTYRVDLLGGFRYGELREELGITEFLVVPAGSTVPRAPGPASILVQDQYKTKNQFYGGQVGVDSEFHYGSWFLGATAKFALGTMHDTVGIQGVTTLAAPGVTTIAAGGLLAQPTNIGKYSHDRVAFIPEVGLKVGYQVNDHVRVYVGYDFLYFNNVVRPGDQIDRVVNVSQLPNITSPATGEPVRGVPRPMFNFKDSDFWAQGINFGLEFRY
jgi:hypothetical protein